MQGDEVPLIADANHIKSLSYSLSMKSMLATLFQRNNSENVKPLLLLYQPANEEPVVYVFNGKQELTEEVSDYPYEQLFRELCPSLTNK